MRKKEKKEKISKAPVFRIKKKLKIDYISTDPLQQNQKTKTIKIPARSFFFLLNQQQPSSP